MANPLRYYQPTPQVPQVVRDHAQPKPHLVALIEGFKLVEVASVADAMEQLYGQPAYMSHEMRPVFTAKFAGPAGTVLMKKQEHKDGASASQGMLTLLTRHPPDRCTSWCFRTAVTSPASAD